MKKFFYICLLMGVVSCVSKTEHEDLEFEYRKLQLEKENLEKELSELRSEYYEVRSDHDRLLNARRKEEMERKRKKYVSESEALDHIKDYYNFYKGSTAPRDIKLRRTDKNSFVVSLKSSIGMMDSGITEIYHLKVNNDDTYTFMRTSY